MKFLSASTTLIVACTLAGCGRVAPTDDARDATVQEAGSITLTSVPEQCSVFLDGRYVGETGPEGPLVFARPPGTGQLRVGAPGHVDLVEYVAFEAALDRRMRAELLPRAGATRSVAATIQLGVGQVARGFLPAGSSGVVYVFDGRAGQERNLVLHHSDGAAEFVLSRPDGSPVVSEEIASALGNPPELMRRKFLVDRDGTWTLRIQSKVDTNAGFYVFGFEKAVPARYDDVPPGMGRRLHPGKPERR